MKEFIYCGIAVVLGILFAYCIARAVIFYEEKVKDKQHE